MIENLITRQNTNRLLLSLVLLDIVLSSTGYLLPGVWFKIFHGVSYIDPQGFLQRCAGNWAMFTVLQTIALYKWEKNLIWLGVVAGVRLSDMLTDWSYLWFCSDITWFGRLALFNAGPFNLLCGLYLYYAYKRFNSTQSMS